MVKVVMTLTAAAAALLLARLALSTGTAKRAGREKSDLKGEIRRWEDEGGAIASTPPKAPETPEP